MSVSEESQKLGINVSLILLMFVLCSVCGRFCKKHIAQSPHVLYDEERLSYQNMNTGYKMSKRVAFGMMVCMTLINYLTNVIYIVGTSS